MPRTRKLGEYTDVGHRIMKFAKRQVSLAKALKLSQQSVSKKLRGDVEWRVSELQKIAKHYETTVSELLEGRDA